MRVTNKLNIPSPWYEAAKRSIREPWKDPKKISATELSTPGLVRALTRARWDEIEVDASDLLYPLLGQGMHAVLAGISIENCVTEERLEAQFNGWTITGQPDLVEFSPTDGAPIELWDWKTCKLYELIHGIKPEWEAQVNVYRWLLGKKYARMPNRAYIFALAKDWSKPESYRKAHEGYPQHHGQTLEVPCWSQEKIESWIAKRLEDHERSPAQVCTAEERWAQPDKWAVTVPGRKTALKLFESPVDAHQLAGKTNGARVEHRPAVSTRCALYCNVAPFCSFGAGEQHRYRETLKHDRRT